MTPCERLERTTALPRFTGDGRRARNGEVHFPDGESLLSVARRAARSRIHAELLGPEVRLTGLCPEASSFRRACRGRSHGHRLCVAAPARNERRRMAGAILGHANADTLRSRSAY
jgi:hypothetical protein